MREIFFVIVAVLLLNISLALAQEHNFAETRQLIDSGIGCDELTDGQLEAMGDYYMEQMHPGEAHEIMDKMMGGEGSDSLRGVHINMAKRLYCNEDIGGMVDSGSMMGMAPMMMGGGMMSWQAPQTNMVGSWGYLGYWGLLDTLYIILLVGIIVLVYLWIVKLWKDSYGKKR